MANVALIVSAVVSTVETCLSSEKISKTLFGEYADGTPRNLPDAIRGEVFSPKRKGKKKKGKKKDGKKKKKKSKKKQIRLY